MTRALIAGSVAILMIACGGKSNSDALDDAGGSGGTTADSGGTGGTQGTDGPSSGGNGSTAVTAMTATSGGTSSGGTAMTATSNGTSGGASSGGASTTDTVTSGGGGPSDERCTLPLEAGSCNAYFQPYGYNVETSRCEQFVYGGCGGNDNRFDTLEDCLDVCDPGGRSACENTSDCVIDHSCCGFCGVTSVDQLVAVNHNYASFSAPECGLVECEECAAPPEIDNFGARCNEGSCEVYDVRTSDLSACETDADCRLRVGLGCCEGCGGVNWVAVSADYEHVEKELCGDAPLPCPPCVAPPPPDDIRAKCGADGHCAISNFGE